MYLNQFTNTKRITYGRSGSYSDAYSEYRSRGIPSICVCLFYKMTYDILSHTLSASKMSSTSYNCTKKGSKTITVPHRKTCSPPPALPKTLQHQYLLRIFTGFKYIHPLLSKESHLERVTRGWNTEPTNVWCFWYQHEGGGGFHFISIHKYLHYSHLLILVFISIINKWKYNQLK